MSSETATAEAASTPDQPIISIKAVHKSFSDLEVLKGVSIDVMKGEVMAAPALGCPAAGKPDFGLWGRRVSLNRAVIISTATRFLLRVSGRRFARQSVSRRR